MVRLGDFDATELIAPCAFWKSASVSFDGFSSGSGKTEVKGWFTAEKIIHRKVR